jgi:hypothetical protein
MFDYRTGAHVASAAHAPSGELAARLPYDPGRVSTYATGCRTTAPATPIKAPATKSQQTKGRAGPARTKQSGDRLKRRESPEGDDRYFRARDATILPDGPTAFEAGSAKDPFGKTKQS